MAASILRRLARAFMPAAAPAALSLPFPIPTLAGAWHQSTPDRDWHFLAFDLHWPSDPYRLPHFVRQLLIPAGPVAAMHLILRCETQPADAMNPWLAQHLRADNALLSRMITERAHGLTERVAPRQLKARLILRLAPDRQDTDELVSIHAHLRTMADAMGAHMAPVAEIGLPADPTGECLELTPWSPDIRLEPVLERMIQAAPTTSWTLVTTLVPASAASITKRHASGPRAEALQRQLDGGHGIAQVATQLQLDPGFSPRDEQKILSELHRGAIRFRWVTASKQPLYWPRPRQVRTWPHVTADELYARVPILPVARRNNRLDGTPWLTPYNEVAYFSPFNSDMGHNTLMVGCAGSGITVTLRDILTAHLAAGGQATVFDAYYSYADFGQLFGATSIRCGTLPDPLVGMDRERFWDFEHLIVEWVCTLFSPATDLARTAIRAGLAEAWQRHPDGISLPLLIEGLAHVADQTTCSVAAAAIMLASTLSTESPFVCSAEPTAATPLTIYDIEAVEPALRPVALATLLVIEAQKWRLDCNTRKLLILDDLEPSHLAGNEALLAVLLRTGRRYNAGVIITTRPGDMVRTPIGPVLLNHISHLIFSQVKPEDLQTLGTHLGWTPAELALYQTAGPIGGREVRLIYRGPNSLQAMRVILDPFNMSALSGSHRYLAPIRKVLAKGGAPVAAVEAAMAEQRACL